MQQQQQQQQQQQPSFSKAAHLTGAAFAARSAPERMQMAVAEMVRSCRPRAPVLPASSQMELELRFGGDANATTKTDYDRVAAAVRSQGWQSVNHAGAPTPESLAGDLMLRIIPQQQQGAAAVRAEIMGRVAIEAYCHHNTLDSVLAHHAVSAAVNQQTLFFTRKSDRSDHVEFADLEFRLAMAVETRLAPEDVAHVTSRWTQLPKFFRHMNRVRFAAPGGCVALDLSIVHSNRAEPGGGGGATMGTTTAAAGMFSGKTPTRYEVELEVLNAVVARRLDAADRAAAGKLLGEPNAAGLRPHEQAVADGVLAELHRAIRLVLGGLQDTAYPVGRAERAAVLAEYTAVARTARPVFVGPSPVALHRRHLLPPPALADDPMVGASILRDYCVTDKADGQRALLFVSARAAESSGGGGGGGSSGSGRIYLITPKLDVVFTGMRSPHAACRHLLLDGEHIAHAKLYAAFDLYAAQDTLLMGLPFDDDATLDATLATLDATDAAAANAANAADAASAGRLPPFRRARMEHYVRLLGAEPVPGARCALTVRAKRFYAGADLLKQSAALLRTVSATLEYATDGLIFTPLHTAVCGNVRVRARSEQEERAALAAFRPPAATLTWNAAYKWKPPKDNSNDFLVHFVTARGAAAPRTFYDADGGGAPAPYRKLWLLCGHNRGDVDDAGFRRDAARLATHMQTRLVPAMLAAAPPPPPLAAEPDDEVADYNARVGRAFDPDRYRPQVFRPALPYDPEAHLCRCALVGDTLVQGDSRMRTEAHEPIQNNTVVEFRFDPDARAGWGWVPMRVRHDKTALLRAGKDVFGNHAKTAIDNWHSMHYPVTEAMICGDVAPDAPEQDDDDDVYYRGNSDKQTHALSAFHNQIVKRVLIERAALWLGARTLVDFAAGKAGDLFKWNDARLTFVLGLDLSSDNVLNARDGAVARYMGQRGRRAAACVFLQADSALNVRSGAAFTKEVVPHSRAVARAIFGDARAAPGLAPALVNRARGGFDLASLQFALHYFWRSRAALHGLLRNLAECVRAGGAFVGTCYDGAQLFARLEAGGGTLLVAGNGRAMLRVARLYGARAFEPRPDCVGLPVSVYMDSINKEAVEYLVNFDYLDALLAEYGFDLASEDEMVAMQHPRTGEGGRRSFERVYANEPRAQSRAPGGSGRKVDADMTPQECEISFLNRLFVYVKKRELTPTELDALHTRHVVGDADTDAPPLPDPKRRRKLDTPASGNAPPLQFTGLVVYI